MSYNSIYRVQETIKKEKQARQNFSSQHLSMAFFFFLNRLSVTSSIQVCHVETKEAKISGFFFGKWVAF